MPGSSVGPHDVGVVDKTGPLTGDPADVRIVVEVLAREVVEVALVADEEAVEELPKIGVLVLLENVFEVVPLTIFALVVAGEDPTGVGQTPDTPLELDTAAVADRVEAGVVHAPVGILCRGAVVGVATVLEEPFNVGLHGALDEAPFEYCIQVHVILSDWFWPYGRGAWTRTQFQLTDPDPDPDRGARF